MCQNATINSETSFSVSGCITLGNSPLTVDITSASAEVNGTLGKYADTNTLQAGTTYRYFVPTINRNFSISGGAVLIHKLVEPLHATLMKMQLEANAKNVTHIAGNVNGTASTTATFSSFCKIGGNNLFESRMQLHAQV